ncbi:MAG: hypothetical protein Roseis2KO_57940 [Roseivirga sp.]
MKRSLQISAVFVFLLLAMQVSAQKTAFTVADAINVKSFGSQTLSPDGKFLAGVIADGRARFGTDHFRFRDPSYLNLRAGELVIIDTGTGDEMRPFDASVRAINLTWNSESNLLAFFQQKGDKLVLSYYDTDSKKVKDVKLKDDRAYANNSGILFKAGTNEVLVRVRSKGWMERAMAEYIEATTGPVVVYDGSKDFLKWDKIGATSGFAEVVAVKLSTGKVKDVLPESSYGGLSLSKDGQYLVYDEIFRLKTSYKRNSGTEYQVAFKNLNADDSATVIYEKNKRRRRYNWDNTGKHFAYVDSGNVFIGDLGTIASAEPVNITKDKAFEDDDKKKAVKFSVQRWDSQSERLLLSSKSGWWTIDKSGDNLEKVYDLPEDEEEKKKLPNRSVVKWGDNSNFVYVSYSEKDQWKRGIQRFNLSTGKFEDLMTDGNLYNSWRFSESGEVIVYSKSDGDKPNNVFVNNNAFSGERQLTNLNPWVSDKKWTKSELITYRNADGNEMKGVLYYPVDYDPNKKYPLVLEVYETFFNNGYRSSMNLIANQGYFGLRPSVELEQGYPGEAWLKGVTSAINKLVDEGKVDNDKVGVHGTSYGGYATSLLITQTDRFAAAINISGKVNIISFLGDSPKIGTRNYAAAEVGQDRIGGSFWDEPLKYFQTSAVFFADRIKTPHLLLSGEGDWNVPGTNTRELYYAMRRLGKDVTWVNYMRGGHGAGWASVESDYHDQWKRMFEFYDKYFYPEKKKEGKEKATETDQGNR